MAEAVGKTPVSELQENSIKCGITPKYEFDQQQGLENLPTFWCRVTAEVTGMPLLLNVFKTLVF